MSLCSENIVNVKTRKGTFWFFISIFTLQQKPNQRRLWRSNSQRWWQLWGVLRSRMRTMLACLLFEIHLPLVACFFSVKTRIFKKCATKVYILPTSIFTFLCPFFAAWRRNISCCANIELWMLAVMLHDKEHLLYGSGAIILTRDSICSGGRNIYQM